MASQRTLNAFCPECDDITPHEARSGDVETCHCLVCDHEQRLVVA